MSEDRLNIRLTATDEAGTVLEDTRQRVDELDSSAKRTSKGFIEFGAAASRLGASAFVAYDRIAIAQAAVENAELRQIMAQERLNYATQKYGSTSREATLAQQQLEIATRGVEIAQQRSNIRMIFGVAVVLPQMISGIKGLITAAKALDLANISNTLTTNGLTAARLALLATTVVGIPLAIGLGAAIAGGAFNAAPAPSNLSVYGDINVTGPSNPASFARAVADESKVSANRAGRG